MKTFNISQLPPGPRTVGELFESEDGSRFVYTDGGWVRLADSDMANLVQKARFALNEVNHYLTEIHRLHDLKRR